MSGHVKTSQGPPKHRRPKKIFKNIRYFFKNCTFLHFIKFKFILRTYLSFLKRFVLYRFIISFFPWRFDQF